MSVQFRLSDHQLSDLKRISELDVDALEKARQRFSNLQTLILRPKELIDAIQDILGGEADVVVRQLLSLQGLMKQSGESPAAVKSALRRAIERQGSSVGLTREAWEEREAAFMLLVENRNVRFAAIALEMSYDYANLLRRTRILTDIRPIFNDNADQIEGAVVSHTLRLHFTSADGEHELSIALDSADVKALADQCVRSLTKAETARAMVAERWGVVVTVSGGDAS